MEKLDIDAVRAELKKLLGKSVELLGETTHEADGIRAVNLSLSLYLWGEAASFCSPKKIAAVVREYLAPRPTIAQMVVVTEKFEEETEAVVVSIDDEEETFIAKTMADGTQRGPFRFVDMFDTWRKS